MWTSIRTKLTLSHLLVIVVAMGLSGFLLLSSLERYFLQAMEDSLVAQARITAQALIPGVVAAGPAVEAQAPAYNNAVQQQAGNIALQTANVADPPAGASLGNLDLAHLADASLQLSAQLDTRIRILDARGIVLVDSGPEGAGVDLHAEPLVAQALDGAYASRTDQPRRGGDAAMHLAMPLFWQGDGSSSPQLAGVVYLSQPLRDIVAVLRDLRTLWLLPTLIALLAAGGVGLLLSRAVARPLHRLTAASAQVAEGHLDQQVPVQSRDELGRLSQVFNQMTERLQAARQMQIDFVANVSHELRTPLTAIKGTVETLRDGAVDDPMVRDRFLETVEGETDRLIDLVNDLLLLSRTDSAALDLQCASLDLVRLAGEVVGRLALSAEERQVRVDVVAAPRDVVAWGDPDRVEQILFNLLDNAIKYSRSGDRVVVRLGGGPGEETLVQVEDEGIGIPVPDLARIGERFYRADRARSRAQGGSGLGLSIARALVEAHGGRLWVESEEGVGTVVRFTLPPGP